MQVINALPQHLAALIDEVPVIVDDAPDPALIATLRAEWDVEENASDQEIALELCGLHTGRMLTERSVVDPMDLPEHIHLFRTGIIAEAGGWVGQDADDRVYEEIAVTLLHEIGHHFGLEEEDLEELGYN